MGFITASREKVEWAIYILDRIGDGEANEMERDEFFAASSVLSGVAISAFDMADRIEELEGELKVLTSPGAKRIAVERQRQVNGEGWTPEHDDQHNSGEMALAAACYAAWAASEEIYVQRPAENSYFSGNTGDRGDRQLQPARYYKAWPWDAQWWKPKTRLRDLERAGALIAAEIDRLLRREDQR